MNSASDRGTSTSGGVITPSPRSSRQGRQDLNHLLGFYAAPRVIQPALSLPPRRSNRRGNGAAVDKQRFVNAQMRFILNPTGDYTAHFTDPDIFFDWSDVLQVVISTSSALSTASLSSPLLSAIPSEGHTHTTEPTCPICLTPPNASRMSRCGHVFCFGCILHYLALADGTKYRKCPVCYDPIYGKDLKPVQWSSSPSSPSSTSNLSPSRYLKMRLMRRPGMTTLALPRSSTWPSDALHPVRTPWIFTPDVLTFGKFMLGTPEALQRALEGDLKELEKEMVELRSWAGTGTTGGGNEDELGITFVRAAMVKVKEDIDKVEELRTTSVLMAKKLATRELKDVEDRHEKREQERVLRGVVREAGEATDVSIAAATSSSEVEGESMAPMEFLLSKYSTTPSLSATLPPPSSPSPSVTTSSMKNRNQRRSNLNNPPPPSETIYYFYQSSSGHHIFLDPLDTRILTHHFGDYDSFPSEIDVVVEGIDEGSMNEEMRRKHKYLGHLPSATDVVFVEADLSNIVSAETLESFNAALKVRRGKRRDRGRREDKAKLKSELRDSFTVDTTSASNGLPASYVYSHREAVSIMPYAGFLQSNNFPATASTSSFSSAPPTSSPLHTTSASSPPSTSSTTIWGTRQVPVTHSTTRANDYHEIDDEYDEEWRHFEEYAGRRGGNLTTRGGSSGSNSGGGAGSGGGGGAGITGGGGKKGKKGKKLVLSLTSGRGTG